MIYVLPPLGARNLFVVPQGFVPQGNLGRRRWCRTRQRVKVFFRPQGFVPQGKLFVVPRGFVPQGKLGWRWWCRARQRVKVFFCPRSFVPQGKLFVVTRGFVPQGNLGWCQWCRACQRVSYGGSATLGNTSNRRQQYSTTNEGRCCARPLHSSPGTDEESGR